MRRKPRLVDKIAHGMSMFLSGPAPGFGLALGKLGGQALKGITDNVQHYRRQRGGGWWSDLKRNTRQGYKETQDLIKQNKVLQRLLTNRPWGGEEDYDDDVVNEVDFKSIGPRHGRIRESRGLGNG